MAKAVRKVLRARTQWAAKIRTAHTSLLRKLNSIKGDDRIADPTLARPAVAAG